jgi:hypothetical protein
MIVLSKDDKPQTGPSESDGEVEQDNGLRPMLIGGHVLIVIGAVIVMMFV